MDLPADLSDMTGAALDATDAIWLMAKSMALTTEEDGEVPVGTWTERFLSLIGREA
jgi:hypothetical protein